MRDKIEVNLGMPGYFDDELIVSMSASESGQDGFSASGSVTYPGSEFTAVQRVLLKVSAGVTGYRVEHIDGNGPPIFFRTDWLASRRLKSDRLYALKVSGESMEPGLWDGDLVVMNSADRTLSTARSSS